MVHVSRRDLLLATASGVSLAGCASLRPRQEGVVLLELITANWLDEPVEFHILIEYDGEIVHWSSHTAEGRDGVRLDGETVPDMPVGPGDITVHARVGNKRRSMNFVEAGDEGKCVKVRVMCESYGDERRVSIVRITEDCPEHFE